MPLPSLVLFTFVSGLLAALAGRADLRVNPKPIARSPAFFAYLFYPALVLVPVSLYFFVFHGDWYVLYLLDTARVPSALVLVACLCEVGVGALGFWLGGLLIRAQREQWAGVLVGVVGSLGLAVVPLAYRRLSVVGSYAQFQGDFGLEPYGGALLHGSLWMTLWLLVSLGFLVYRLGPGAQRA